MSNQGNQGDALDHPNSPTTIGCLGARDLPPAEAAACRAIAADLVRGGYALVTGAPPGEPGRDPWADWADAAFAYGATRADPARLTICLPWRHFPHGAAAPDPAVSVAYPADHPEWTATAARFWSATHDPAEGEWSAAVPRAPRLRYTRNAGIILAAPMLLVWPRALDATGSPDAAGDGGDDADEIAFALALAEWADVPALDLTQTTWWTVAPALVERLRAEQAHDTPASP